MYVYLIRSKAHPEQRYVGLTSNLKKRLREHDARKSPHTSKFAAGGIGPEEYHCGESVRR